MPQGKKTRTKKILEVSRVGTYNEDDGIRTLGSDSSIHRILDTTRQLVLLQILLDRHGAVHPEPGRSPLKGNDPAETNQPNKTHLLLPPPKKRNCGFKNEAEGGFLGIA